MLCNLFNWSVADRAWFASFAVDKKLLSEIAGLAILAREVAQRGASLHNGLSKNLFDGDDQFFGSNFR